MVEQDRAFLGRFLSDSLNIPSFSISNRALEVKFQLGDYLNGYYKACLAASSASHSIAWSGPDTILFSINKDTAVVRDFGSFTSQVGPKNQHASQDGDGIGMVFSIDSSGSFYTYPVSASYYIPSDTALVGVSVSPRIWGVVNTNTVTSNLSGTSPFTHTISQNDLGGWLTLPFFPPPSLQRGNYLVGLEQISGAAQGKGISLGLNLVGRRNRGILNAAVFLNDSTQARWSKIASPLGIRLNINYGSGGCTTIGLNESDLKAAEVEIFPNPSSGMLSFRNAAAYHEVNFFDLKGRLVKSLSLRNTNRPYSIAELETGIYMLQFRGQKVNYSQKLVVQ